MSWIKCSEQLPWRRKCVLVYGPNEWVDPPAADFITWIAFYDETMPHNPWQDLHRQCRNPTHWMPLPEPPHDAK